MTKELHVAVVIPCYKVAEMIEAVVREVPPSVRTIIAVDDASPDDTGSVLSRLVDPRLVVLTHKANRGVGGAVISGYREALDRGADICVKVDGDGQMRLDHLDRLLEPLISGQADFSKGNRFHHVEALRAMPKVRLVGNGGLSFLTKLVSGYWSVFDPTNGYTAIRADTLRQVGLQHVARRYFFETSMLAELNIIGARVCDVPIPARYGDEQSSLRVGQVLVSFPPLMVKSLSRRFFWRYMIRDFNVLTLCVLTGLPLLLFGLVFGAYHWWRSVATGMPATAGTTLLAALPVILGYLSLLVAAVIDMISEPGTARPKPLDLNGPKRD